MDRRSGPLSTSCNKAVHHKIWTKHGERHFAAGEVAHISESEKTSEVRFMETSKAIESSIGC